MADIIIFPSTTEKEFSNGTNLAKEMEREKKTTEEFLNYRLNFSDWNEINLSERDAQMVALFGEHMKLAPVVAARLTAKLSTILCKAKNLTDPLEEYL